MLIKTIKLKGEIAKYNRGSNMDHYSMVSITVWSQELKFKSKFHFSKPDSYDVQYNFIFYPKECSPFQIWLINDRNPPLI